jgi:hypothetical protein
LEAHNRIFPEPFLYILYLLEAFALGIVFPPHLRRYHSTQDATQAWYGESRTDDDGAGDLTTAEPKEITRPARKREPCPSLPKR